MIDIPFWAWSWLLTITGATGVFLAGDRRTRLYGWATGIAVQVLWVAYALSTVQYGFLFSVALYGSIYVRNFIKEYRENNT